MAIYIKVNNTEYLAAVNGIYNDRTWDGRDTKIITLTMPYAQAAEIAVMLPDGAPWSLIEREDVLDESGAPTGQTVDHERDMSEYSLSGDITDHRNGTVSIKMGKATEAEILRAQLKAIEEAYDGV